MPVPSYWTIVDSVHSLVAALPQLSGASFRIRPSPAFLASLGDTLPLVCVCPRRDQWENASEQGLYMGNGAIIGYPVIIAVLIENRFDQAQLRFQMDARDTIRRALWNPTALRAYLADSFDVDYEPNPAGVDLSAVSGAIDATVQQFTWKVDETRASE